MRIFGNTFRVVRVLLGQRYIFLLLGALVIGETWRISSPDYDGARGMMTRSLYKYRLSLRSTLPPGIIFAGSTICGGVVSRPLVHVFLDNETGQYKVGPGRGSDPDALRVYVTYQYLYAQYGLWTQCARSKTATVHASEGPWLGKSPLADDDPRLLAVAQWLGQQDPHVFWDNGPNIGADFLDNRRQWTILWTNVLHDIALTAVTIAFAASPFFIFLNWRNHNRQRNGFCPGCSYDLTGLTAPICPECGQSIASAPGTI
jgi:hypothetical protein